MMTQNQAPTKEDVEQGLTDEEINVRLEWAGRLDFTPTLAQTERGLTDEHCRVRWRWAKRLDFIPTSGQVERGLSDEDNTVRFQWSKRRDFIPTSAQTERGLTEANSLHRISWILRDDLTINLDALNRVVAWRSQNNVAPLREDVESLLRSQAETSQLSSAVDNHGDCTRLQEPSRPVL